MSGTITFKLNLSTLPMALKTQIGSRGVWAELTNSAADYSIQAVDAKMLMARNPGPWIRALGLPTYAFVMGQLQELVDMAGTAQRLGGDDAPLVVDCIDPAKNYIRIINHDALDRAADPS